MKRFLISITIFLMIPTVIYGADNEYNEYNEYLNQFDFSFMDSLSDDAKDVLNDLGIADFDFEMISSLSVSEIANQLKIILINKIKTPLKSCVGVLVFILLSALFNGLKVNDNSSLDSVYSTISSLVIATILLVKIGDTIKFSSAALSISADFVYAFVPVFCSIIAVGGGITTSFSTNSMLLMLSQSISFVSSNLFMPIINSFLAIGVCSGLRSELNLGSLLSTIKRVITTTISVIAAMFVSILSIKTAVASKSDILGIRSVRFLINSVVPVIGGSISEGLLSIQSYSSLVKSSVGVVGIIAVVLLFLPSILEVACWRLVLSICTIASDMFCDNSVSLIVKAFRDTLLLINVILILSLVTTIISIGILIASRTT